MNYKKTTLKYKAFTMAEAVLVMTILGIIATVMITTIKPAQFKEHALKIKTTKVMNDIDQATHMIMQNHSKDGTMTKLVTDDGINFNACHGVAEEGQPQDHLIALYKKI